MNPQQKKIAIGMLATIIAMLIFPPFQLHGANGVQLNLGYSFILNPPETELGYKGRIDIAVLFAQWVGVLLVGVLAALVAPRK